MSGLVGVVAIKTQFTLKLTVFEPGCNYLDMTPRTCPLVRPPASIFVLPDSFRKSPVPYGVRSRILRNCGGTENRDASAAHSRIAQARGCSGIAIGMLFEVVKVWLASGRRAKETFLGPVR